MAIIFKCDKCNAEIKDIKESINIQYAEQKVISQDGKLQNLWVEVKKILCGECKKLIVKLFNGDNLL